MGNRAKRTCRISKLLELIEKKEVLTFFGKGILPVKHKFRGKKLDKAVDKCYGTKSFKNDKERIEFLFGLYYEEYLDE